MATTHFYPIQYIDKLVRGVAMSRLASVEILTLDSGQARLSDRSGKVGLGC